MEGVLVEEHAREKLIQKRLRILNVVKTEDSYMAVIQAKECSHHHFPSNSPPLPTTPRDAVDSAKRHWERAVREWKLDVRAFGEWWSSHRDSIL